MSDSGRGRLRLGRTTAMVTTTASLIVWVTAAPGQPSGGQESNPACPLYDEGAGDNGTVAYEIPGAQPEGVGFDPRDCSFYTAGSFFRGEVYRGRLDQRSASGGSETLFSARPSSSCPRRAIATARSASRLTPSATSCWLSAARTECCSSTS
jgi:hypothetical protein